MTAFKNWSDEQVMATLRREFDHLTGAARPVTKKPGLTHVDGNTVEQHFVGGHSFLSMVIFNQAVLQARARGLLNVVEEAMVAEVLAILSEV